MQQHNQPNKLLKFTASIEAVAGLTLIAAPSIFVWLLLGTELVGAGVAIGRVAGCALLALAIACWPARDSVSNQPALRAMLTYNVLVAIYLFALGIQGEMVGLLLWPGVALHGILSLLLAWQWKQEKSS